MRVSLECSPERFTVLELPQSVLDTLDQVWGKFDPFDGGVVTNAPASIGHQLNDLVVVCGFHPRLLPAPNEVRLRRISMEDSWSIKGLTMAPPNV